MAYIERQSSDIILESVLTHWVEIDPACYFVSISAEKVDELGINVVPYGEARPSIYASPAALFEGVYYLADPL